MAGQCDLLCKVTPRLIPPVLLSERASVVPVPNQKAQDQYESHTWTVIWGEKGIFYYSIGRRPGFIWAGVWYVGTKADKSILSAGLKKFREN